MAADPVVGLTGLVALVVPPGFFVAFVVGFLVGVVGRPEIVPKNVKILQKKGR